ncbi:MAG: sigma-70 family RNA polymerase sigma factor [Elusimicrobiaceae bacterium]|nr:sigma-70 family RNA polymerase sigma factor [Elusimicrobiaceae bacterium]
MQFEELYETFFVRVYNYARYRCETDTEAEDLTACIFEKLYRKFNSYNADKSPIEAWIFTIAHSVTVDFFRRKKIRSWFSFTPQQEENLPMDDNPAHTLERTSLEEELQAALEVLTSQERELINLHYYQRLKQTDIAAITGLSQSNVGVLLHRAVKKLKFKLGNEL